MTPREAARTRPAGSPSPRTGLVLMTVVLSSCLNAQTPEARRSYYGTIVRANLITLAHAESAYFHTHGTFTDDPARLPPRENGTPFEFTSNMVVTIDLRDSVHWEASAWNTGDTSVVCYISGAVRNAVPRRTETSCPHLDATRHRIAGGLSLNLPVGWVVRDSAGLSQWNTALGAAARELEDSGAPQQPDPTRAGVLLVAHGPARATVTLALIPVPDATPHAFADFTTEDREAYLAQTCERLESATRTLSGPPVRCGEVSADSIRSGEALLLQYEYEEAGRWVHVWMVQAATSGAVLSLTFQAEADRTEAYAPTFRLVWRSLIVPERLSANAG